MKKAKPNICLSNLAEIKSGGIALSLRKGINELVNKTNSKPKPHNIITPKHNYDNILSVIICTANKNSSAENTVKSLLKQNFDQLKYEIIIVNNSQTTYNCEKFKDSIHIVNEPQQGISYARNTGAGVAKGEYILYIDDDATANTGLLENMYSSFLSKPASIIGGQIFLSLPTPVPEVFLEGKESLWSAYTVPYKKYREVREHYEFPYGACFGIRHSVLDILGGFPEAYGRVGDDYSGGEETAVCFAALNHGFKIAIEPNASVTHNVLPNRFTKEHIRKTIRAGILTTYRLCKDGYTPYTWTLNYIEERIKIAEKELMRLDGISAFYKQCEYDAFSELAKTKKGLI